jgi:hypothetical protein
LRRVDGNKASMLLKGEVVVDEEEDVGGGGGEHGAVEGLGGWGQCSCLDGDLD